MKKLLLISATLVLVCMAFTINVNTQNVSIIQPCFDGPDPIYQQLVTATGHLTGTEYSARTDADGIATISVPPGQKYSVSSTYNGRTQTHDTNGSSVTSDQTLSPMVW